MVSSVDGFAGGASVIDQGFHILIDRTPKLVIVLDGGRIARAASRGIKGRQIERPGRCCDRPTCMTILPAKFPVFAN
jgi:hypothetical protein